MLVNYIGVHRDPQKELIITSLCDKVSKVIALPNTVDIEFQKFNGEYWGGTHLHWKYKNRISINTILSLQEMPLVLVHELIHLNQLNSGMMVVDRNNRVYWQGRHYEITNLSYHDYQKLPWEMDVSHRLKKILELSLST